MNPVVLLEIATFVDAAAPRDLSHLTQVDRLGHDTVPPCLFRYITADRSPHQLVLAVACEDPRPFRIDSLHTGLITIFTVIYRRGLFNISFNWRAVPRTNQA
ncbi:hypothetical protein C8R46DRAFT_1215176 [Mycena filopes]|nr:hypothetical protein C8R46DRAFT_1215176 [Mycena filopes]